MKAKHFKKLRAQGRFYEVELTQGLFGRFSLFEAGKKIYTVFARNSYEAVVRLKKRGVGRSLGFREETTEQWARFKVIEAGKSDHWRNVNYH